MEGNCHTSHDAIRPCTLPAACEACTKSIEKSKGKLVVKEAARAVSERDDRLLAEKMEALENANKEVRWCNGIPVDRYVVRFSL